MYAKHVTKPSNGRLSATLLLRDMHLQFAQQASINTWLWSKQSVDQNDKRWPLKLTIIILSGFFFSMKKNSWQLIFKKRATLGENLNVDFSKN